MKRTPGKWIVDGSFIKDDKKNIIAEIEHPTAPLCHYHLEDELKTLQRENNTAYIVRAVNC